jgi:hypothetical protein
MAEFDDANRRLSEHYYRDEETPLFPALTAVPPPELWRSGQPEYFDMLKHMMIAIADTLSAEGAGGKPAKQFKRKQDKKKG